MEDGTSNAAVGGAIDGIGEAGNLWFVPVRE